MQEENANAVPTVPNKIVPNKKYEMQNCKLWTVNFSSMKFVQKAKIIIPALKKKVALNSIGLTILMCVEYCLQERVIKDFSSYVNSRRRGLL